MSRSLVVTPLAGQDRILLVLHRAQIAIAVVVLFAITPAAAAACPDFAPAVRYDAGSLPLSVASGDFNSDGKPDLATSNELSNSVTILLGTGDGTFFAGGSYTTGTPRGSSLQAISTVTADSISRSPIFQTAT